MNFSRREFLMLELSRIAGFARGFISSSIKDFGFNNYKIDFKINIFSNEEKKCKKKAFRKFRIWLMRNLL